VEKAKNTTGRERNAAVSDINTAERVFVIDESGQNKVEYNKVGERHSTNHVSGF
jgi:hypothetical protein